MGQLHTPGPRIARVKSTYPSSWPNPSRQLSIAWLELSDLTGAQLAKLLNEELTLKIDTTTL